MEAVLIVIAVVVVALLIMVATNIMYDVFGAVIPVFAVLMIAIGVIVGFIVAIKNTFIVCRQVFSKKGK